MRLLRCLVTLSIILVIVSSLSGCSVGMAISGQQDPNLSVVRVGATRGEIEMQLGKPEKTISNSDGTRIDSYKYQIGDVPSAGRAAGYAVLDIISFCLWEIVGVPIEAAQGTNHRCTVTYDNGDKVLAIN